MNKALPRQFLVTFVPAVSLLVAVALAGLVFRVDIALLFRDPIATAGLHPLTGLVSNLGILLWCSAGSTTLFAGLLLREAGSGEPSRFMISSALLSFYLLFDDFFQIHEDLLDRYLGVSEKVLYVMLAVAVLAYLFRFRRLIQSTDYSVLVVAFACLSISIAVDAVLEPLMRGLGQGRIFIEDGAKWLGIAAWCSYYVRTARRFLVDRAFVPTTTP